MPGDTRAHDRHPQWGTAKGGVVRSLPVTFVAPSSPARPLAGFLHPGGERGVVLCPPLGREHLLSYAQFRTLAEDLQATGLSVLRFDYDGTGDSDGGMGDPDRLEAWLLSIEAAADYLRSLGVTSLSLVGLRIGALLAVRAAERLPDLEGLVLWDPQTSGKAFLREQTFLAGLASAGVTRVHDGSVHAFGTVFPPAAAEQVAKLKLTPAGWPVATRLLVVNRPSEHLPPDLLTSLAPEQERFESREQPGLLESDPPRPAPDTAAAIVRWFAGPSTPALAWPPPSEARVVHDRGGRAVLERPWSSRSGRLYGVITEPLPGTATAGAPSAVLLPAGTWHHIGLGRLWVDLARECAADGVRVLRLSVSGLGESDVRPGQPRGLVYAEEAPLDVIEAVEDFDDGTGVRLVGHCSGGWTALEAALTVLPVSVHAIGVPAYLDLAAWRSVVPDGSAPLHRPSWRSRLHGLILLAVRRPSVERWRSHVPGFVWRLIDITGVLPSPSRRLKRLLVAGVDVHLFGDEVDGVWWRAEGDAWLRSAEQSDGFSATALPLVDHQLATAQSRVAVGARLRDQIVTPRRHR